MFIIISSSSSSISRIMIIIIIPGWKAGRGPLQDPAALAKEMQIK